MESTLRFRLSILCRINVSTRKTYLFQHLHQTAVIIAGDLRFLEEIPLMGGWRFVSCALGLGTLILFNISNLLLVSSIP